MLQRFIPTRTHFSIERDNGKVYIINSHTENVRHTKHESAPDENRSTSLGIPAATCHIYRLEPTASRPTSESDIRNPSRLSITGTAMWRHAVEFINIYSFSRAKHYLDGESTYYTILYYVCSTIGGWPLSLSPGNLSRGPTMVISYDRNFRPTHSTTSLMGWLLRDSLPSFAFRGPSTICSSSSEPTQQSGAAAAAGWIDARISLC